MNVNEAISRGAYVSQRVTTDGERSGRGPVFSQGDILEGTVLGTDDGTTVSLRQGEYSREVRLPEGMIRGTYAGDVRRFEVVEATPDKLVLKDLGSIYGEGISRGMQAVTVNAGLVTLVDDFRETMGTDEKEDNDNIERLSDEDYSELRAEGFSIERFKAERLARAIDRVKTARRERRDEVTEEAEKLKKQSASIRKQSAKAAAKAAASSAASGARAYEGLEELIAERLETADLPVTRENIADIAGAVRMGEAAADMGDGAYAYLIKNELEPTASNIYRSVYAGSARRTRVDEETWKALEGDAARIASEAGAELSDAEWMLEYDIPITAENLRYRKALAELKDGYAEGGAFRTIDEAVAAIYRGGKAADALLTGARREDGSFDPSLSDDLGDVFGPSSGAENRGAAPEEVRELNHRLGLEEARLKLTVRGLRAMRELGIEPRTDELTRIVETLRELERSEYRRLAEELGVGDSGSAEAERAALTLQQTQDVTYSITRAGDDIFAATFEERHTITYRALGELAAARYDASATEVRADLGDSIERAFTGIDDILAAAGEELTDAGRRAVRILARNGMELSGENIGSMKYYSSKVLGLADRMKPVAVMGLIRRGINPLDLDIDTLDGEVNALLEEEGYSAEEKYSEFLYRMENSGSITERERAAYIGIYRLLYRITKDDGAAIGAALRSGRRLTLRNLLTESRSRTGSGVNEVVGDETVSHTSYVNAIDREISEAFDFQRSIVREVESFTEAGTWQEALPGGDGVEDITPEELYEKLKNADNDIRVYDHAAETVREMMTADPGARRFLRSFGLDADTEEIKSLSESETAVAVSKEELMELLSGEKENGEGYETRIASARAELLARMGGQSDATSALGLTAQLARYNLLRSFSGEHRYEYTVGGPGGARVNLTVIGGTGESASVHIEVRSAAGTIRADLGMSDDGTLLDGRVACESDRQRQEALESFEGFEAALLADGFDTAELRFITDKVSDTRYRDRLGEIKRRAAQQAQTAGGDTEVADSEGLYRVARKFLEYFL